MELFTGIALIIIVFITGINVEKSLKNIQKQNKEMIELLKKKNKL